MGGIKKYGTFAGVFTPSILTILGVIMYMRMGAVVGNSSSIWMTIGIIVFAHVISITTGLSVSSVATDKKIKAGGIYYMLSRSLGLPIGGAIGVTIFVATALSIALYLIGFAESALVVFNFEDYSVNHLRVGGSIALALVVTLALISTSLAMKAQYFILAIIALSLVSIGFGDASGLKEGVESMPSVSFAVLFGIFFPAVTGFTAGVAMSGDLKNPVKSIPWGTMMAIAVGLIVYLGLSLFLYYSIPSNILKTNYNAIVEFAWYGGLFVVAGIWGATLSSALGGVLGAPRILQAMSMDTITPKLFGKGVGVNNEPRNALILTAIIAFCGIMIGELNAIAEIVAMFYMTAYLFINMSCFLEQWASPDFKPSFKISIFIPLLGAVATAILMIQLNLVAALIAIGAVILLFFYYSKKHLDSGSGDVWNSVWFSLVKTGLKNLQKKSTHKRNWEPNVLLFSGESSRRKELIDFSKSIAGKNGMISNFDLIENKSAKVLFPKHQQTKVEMDENDGSIFYRQQECQNIYRGIENIANSYGFSGIDPNTVMMGWARNSSQPEEFAQMTDYLTQMDMNVLFLDYDERYGFGEKKTLDIWWSHFDEYCDLSLYLSKFMMDSVEWSQLKVRILYNNGDNSTADYIEKIISSKCETNRIEAEIVVVNNELEQKSLYELVRKYSIETDLIFLELPFFQEHNEKVFIENTNSLLHDIGTTLIFRASTHFYEDINLDPSLQKEYAEIQSLLEFERKEVDFTAQSSMFEEVDQLTAKIGGELYDLHYKFSQEVYQSYQEVYHSFIKVVKGIQESELKGESQLKAAFDDFKENRIVDIKRSLQKGMKTLLIDCQDVVSDVPSSFFLQFDSSYYAKSATDSKEVQKWKSKVAKNAGKHKFQIAKSINHHIETSYLKDFKKVLNVNGLSGFMLNNYLMKSVQDGVSFDEILEKLETVIKREQNIFQQFSKNYIQKFLQKVIDDSENVMIEAVVADREEERNDQEIKKVLFGLSKYPDAFVSNQKLLTNQLESLFQLQGLQLALGEEVVSAAKGLVNIIKEDKKDIGANVQSWLELDKSEYIKSERGITSSVVVSGVLNKLNGVLNEELARLSEEVKVIAPESLNGFEKNQENVNVALIAFKKTTTFAIEREFFVPIGQTFNAADLELKNHVSELNKSLKLLQYHYDDSQARLEDEQSIRDLISQKLDGYLECVNNVLQSLKTNSDVYVGKLNDILDVDVLLNQTNFSQSAYLKSKAMTSGAEYIGRTKTTLRKIDQKLDNVLIRLRDTVSKSSFENRTKSLLNLQSRLGDFVSSVALNDEVSKRLPYYYQQLFTGKQIAPNEVLKQREVELELASSAVKKWNAGSSGIILFTGELQSGKTYVKQNFINTVYQGVEVIHIDKGQSRRTSFEALLQKTTGVYKDIDSILNSLPDGSVVSVSDLEFYWGEEEGGDSIISLLNVFHRHFHRVLFLVDCNIHFYNFAKDVYAIDDYVLSTIMVRPLSTTALKTIIMERHEVGGMKFFWNDKHEVDTKLRLQNRIFTKINANCHGNIGSAMYYWLGAMEGVENNVFVLSDLDHKELDFTLKPEWELMLYQVIMRKSISMDELLALFQDDVFDFQIEVENLLRSKVLIKSLSNELQVNPYVMIFIVTYLRKHQIII